MLTHCYECKSVVPWKNAFLNLLADDKVIMGYADVVQQTHTLGLVTSVVVRNPRALNSIKVFARAAACCFHHGLSRRCGGHPITICNFVEFVIMNSTDCRYQALRVYVCLFICARLCACVCVCVCMCVWCLYEHVFVVHASGDHCVCMAAYV